MLRTLTRKELREQHRTFRLWIMGGILLVSGMLSPLLAKYTPLLMSSLPGVPPELAAIIPPPTILDSFLQYFKNASQFGLLAVIVLNMGVMAQEIERGTAAMLLNKPVRRYMVVLAKWLGGLIGVLVGVVLGALGFTFYTLVLFEPFNLLDFLFMNVLLLIFIAFYLSLALFASTLARTQAMAAAFAFGGLLIALILDALPGIGDYLPSQLLSWGGSLFSGMPQPAWPALITSLVLISIFLIAAVFRFQKEEI